MTIRVSLGPEALIHTLQAFLAFLDGPHPDSLETAAIGVQALGEGLPEDDGALLNPTAAVPLHWLPGEGWQEPAR